MRDFAIESLPKWAQEKIRELQNKVERLERNANLAEQKMERLSDDNQHSLDVIREIANGGNERAKKAWENFQEGKPL